jgi:hypothetical protein
MPAPGRRAAQRDLVGDLERAMNWPSADEIDFVCRAASRS